MVLWRNIGDLTKQLKDKVIAAKLFFNRWMFGAFCISFWICFGFLVVIVGRYNSMAYLRREIIRLQDSLENSGWDIAYDELRFNPWWPLPLLKVKNFSLYSRYEPRRVWKVENLVINTKTFDFHTLELQMSPRQTLDWGDKSLSLYFPHLQLETSFSDDRGIRQILLVAEKIRVENYAEISDFKFGAQRMAPEPVKKDSPFMEIRMQVENISFNPSFKVPLSPILDKISLHAIQIGAFEPAATYQESIYNWLADGGYFDIVNLVWDWKPLIMVGRGDLYLNEKIEPRLHLTTSSKALVPVMDILEEDKILEPKGVFVSRILLNNKAFKMTPEDEFSTVVTPVDYKENKLLIENIPVAFF